MKKRLKNGLRKERVLPHCHLQELLPSFLQEVQQRYEQKSYEVLAGWQEIVNCEWRGMTEASSFEKGVLVVKVKNGALYSVLMQREQNRLLKQLQEKFPHQGIRALKFRIG